MDCSLIDQCTLTILKLNGSIDSLEDYCWINADILLLILAGIGISHSE